MHFDIVTIFINYVNGECKLQMCVFVSGITDGKSGECILLIDSPFLFLLHNKIEQSHFVVRNQQ